MYGFRDSPTSWKIINLDNIIPRSSTWFRKGLLGNLATGWVKYLSRKLLMF